MRQLDSVIETNYKKHIFYWELYYMLDNDLDLKKQQFIMVHQEQEKHIKPNKKLKNLLTHGH